MSTLTNTKPAFTYKVCCKCQESKDQTDYYRCKLTKDGFQSYCKECTKQYYYDNPERALNQRESRRKRNPELFLWRQARDRAKLKGLEFTIAPKDIEIPTHCPILGILLKHCRGKAGPESPSLDRIDSSLGYFKENIRVISHRANTLKRDGTLEEFKLLVNNWNDI